MPAETHSTQDQIGSAEVFTIVCTNPADLSRSTCKITLDSGLTTCTPIRLIELVEALEEELGSARSASRSTTRISGSRYGPRCGRLRRLRLEGPRPDGRANDARGIETGSKHCSAGPSR
jgi:hypothetical protein